MVRDCRRGSGGQVLGGPSGVVSHVRYGSARVVWWKGMRRTMQHLRRLLVAMALSAGVSVALLSGCQVSGTLPDDGPWDSAEVRTGGGSIPDGAAVAGTVATYQRTLGVSARALWALPQVLETGTEVTITGVDGRTDRTTAGNGGLDGRTGGPSGRRFAFGGSYEGDYVVSFARGDSWNTTRVHLSRRNGQRCEIVAGLLSPDADIADVEDGRLRVFCDTERPRIGQAPTLVYATLGGVREARPEIVWVMQTDTDASLLPSGRPDEVFVVAGQRGGKVAVWAQLGNATSRAVGLRVGPS